jgi:DNA-binding CsgD family transcriptional regulator
VEHASAGRVDGVATVAHRPEVYLDRARLAVHYLRDCSSDLTTTLTFAVRNVLDVLQAQSAAVWVCSADGSWECVASAFEGPPLPVDWTSWEALNHFTIQSDTVVTSPRSSRPTNEQHFSVPLVHQGQFSVLHVQSHVMPEHITVAEHFLRLVGPILTGAVCRHRGGHLAPHATLTHRQISIWQLMPSNMTYRQMAQQLGFSESTIKQEAGRIFDRLGVRDRAEAVEHWVRTGPNA